MFYYESNAETVEEPLAEATHYQIGKNRPRFSITDPVEAVSTPSMGLDGLAYGFDPGALKESVEDLPYTKETTIEIISSPPKLDVTVPETMTLEAANVGGIINNPGHMSSMRGELSKKILPFIDRVLNEYNYARRPLSVESIDMRNLCEIVDRSMQCAALEIDAVKDIMMEPKGGAWDRRDLLYGVFEEVVIKEISKGNR